MKELAPGFHSHRTLEWDVNLTMSRPDITHHVTDGRALNTFFPSTNSD